MIDNQQFTDQTSGGLSASYTWLCTKSFRLQGLTAIDEIYGHMSVFSSSLSTKISQLIYSISVKYSSRVKLLFQFLSNRQASTIRPDDSWTTIFTTTPTIMKQSDNMFDSYVGSQGSKIFCPNASGQPLNLTMSFP